MLLYVYSCWEIALHEGWFIIQTLGTDISLEYFRRVCPKWRKYLQGGKIKFCIVPTETKKKFS